MPHQPPKDPETRNPITMLLMTAIAQPKALRPMVRAAAKETVGHLLEAAGVRLREDAERESERR